MTSDNVRACLKRACEEIEDICDDITKSDSYEEISDSSEDRLTGIAEQLRYLAEGNRTDPEASAHPDPSVLDTIRDHLTEITSETNEDIATRLERARDELLTAITVLNDRVDKRREVRNNR